MEYKINREWWIEERRSLSISFTLTDFLALNVLDFTSDSEKRKALDAKTV